VLAVPRSMPMSRENRLKNPLRIMAASGKASWLGMVQPWPLES
jgi:hypothetical protein